jgi:transposase
MDRYVLTDAQWAKMEPHCQGKLSDPGRSGVDNRRFVEAVLWIARTGSPSGFTHEKPKVEPDARSGSCEASPALRGVAVSKLKRVVAEQSQLPGRFDA